MEIYFFGSGKFSFRNLLPGYTFSDTDQNLISEICKPRLFYAPSIDLSTSRMMVSLRLSSFCARGLDIVTDTEALFNMSPNNYGVRNRRKTVPSRMVGI